MRVTNSVVYWGVMLLLVIGGAGCGGATAQRLPGEDTRSMGSVSDFTLKNLDGRHVSLSQYSVKNVVVITFWAPCCESSRQIMIDSQKMHDKLSSQGVVFMGIAIDEPDTRNQVRSFIRQRHISIPILLDEEGDVMGRLNPLRVLPFTLIVNKNGDVTWNHEGYSPGDDALIEAAVLETLRAD